MALRPWWESVVIDFQVHSFKHLLLYGGALQLYHRHLGCVLPLAVSAGYGLHVLLNRHQGTKEYHCVSGCQGNPVRRCLRLHHKDSWRLSVLESVDDVSSMGRRYTPMYLLGRNAVLVQDLTDDANT